MKKLETRQMTLIGLMSALMCVAGPLSVPLPFTPVPDISDKSDHLSDSICTRVQIRYCEFMRSICCLAQRDFLFFRDLREACPNLPVLRADI